MRKPSFLYRAMALILVVAALGAGGILHLTHHDADASDNESPFSCDQCKLVEVSVADLDHLYPCHFQRAGIDIALFSIQAAVEAPENTSAPPRAPPVLS